MNTASKPREGEMKKLIILTMAFLFILTLAACNSEAETTPDPQDISAEVVDAIVTQPDETPEPEAEDTHNEDDPPIYDPQPTEFVFLFGGVPIHMDQDIEELLTQLGEPLGVFEAPSCAFDGIDRIFGFPGMQIHTYPLEDSDLVHTISIRDDSVTTMGGIYLGSSWDDVIMAYGSDYEQDITMFTFTRGQTTLSFFLEDDMVIGITYGLIMD